MAQDTFHVLITAMLRSLFPYLSKDSERDSDWLCSTSSGTTHQKYRSAPPAQSPVSAVSKLLLYYIQEMESRKCHPWEQTVLHVTLRLIVNPLPLWEDPETLEMEEENVQKLKGHRGTQLAGFSHFTNESHIFKKH